MKDIVLKLEKDKCYINSEHFISTDTWGLGNSVSFFKPNTYWKVRIINYLPEEKRLVVQLIDYFAQPQEFASQPNIALEIESIAIPSVDTGQLLRCTERVPPPAAKSKPREIPWEEQSGKNYPYPDYAFEFPVSESNGSFDEDDDEDYYDEDDPLSQNDWVDEEITTKENVDTPPPQKKRITRKLNLEIKADISALTFGEGFVEHLAFIEELKRTVTLQVFNQSIHPEFKSITGLLIQIVGKEWIDITVEVALEEWNDGTLYHFRIKKIHSKDLAKFTCKEITDTLEERRIQKYIRNLINADKNQSSEKPKIRSLNDIYEKCNTRFKNREQFLDDLIKLSTLHAQHLQFLSTKHLLDKFHLRICQHPFSFLFLLEGTGKYHFVLEVYNEELATYVWQVKKKRKALRTKFFEIESIIASFKKSNRMNYIMSKPSDFSRIIHVYTEDSSGFEKWKKKLMKLLV